MVHIKNTKAPRDIYYTCKCRRIFKSHWKDYQRLGREVTQVSRFDVTLNIY